jgi:DNA-binding NarL/FixJ family response regulator
MTMARHELSTRQAEVAALVARGEPDKRIAHRTGLSIETVRVHIQQAAKKAPDHISRDLPRRTRIMLWFLTIPDE